MKTKTLIPLILCAVLASSCDKHETYRLTEIDKQAIPYKLGQVVNFIDSLGQPFVLTVVKDSIGCWTERDGGAILYSVYWTVYQRTVRLQSESGNFNTTLSVKGDNSNILGIGINTLMTYFELRYDKEGNFIDDSNKQRSYASLEINNEIYYNVVEHIIYNIYGYDGNKERLPVRLLYNKTYGILQVSDKDKVLFTIAN